MEGIDKEYGAAWVDTFCAAFRAGDSATTSEMLSDLSGGGRLVAAFHTDTCEFLDEIVNGLHRLNVAVPANVTAAHGIYKSLVTERAPLTRRASYSSSAAPSSQPRPTSTTGTAARPSAPMNWRRYGVFWRATQP